MKRFLTATLLFATALASAQNNPLRLNANLVLPKDSVESRRLTTSLNGFLAAAQQPNEANPFVDAAEQVETFVELDEVRGMEQSGKFKDDFFYKPYLTNVVRQNDSTYLIQVSYLGVADNTPLLRASFDFLAHKTATAFTFSSPLLSRTKEWKTSRVGNNIFHYQTSINQEKLKQFGQYSSAYEQKLKATSYSTDYYCTDNLMELQRLTGVMFKSDYNGRTESVWSASSGNRKLIVFGNGNATFSHFDPHDLFHDKLALVVPRSKVNRAVDEGCAYLYGGSWGLSWKEIFKAFREQVASNKNADWAAMKETPVLFKTGVYENSADYIVTALMVRKIERERGFAGVWELLNAGPAEKGNEKYYQTLERLTGITRANYNEQVWALIDSEK